MLDNSYMHFLQITADLYHLETTEGGGAVQIPQEGAAEFIQEVMY